MKRKGVFVLAFCVILCASAHAAGTSIGKVVSFSGKVLIDSFGKGAFIDVILGDSLYSATVIKTELGGRATIELFGKNQEIPPGATVKIADYAAVASGKRSLGWFKSLGNLFRSFSDSSKKKDDEAELGAQFGSRAANVAEKEGAGEVEWEVEEPEAEKVLPEARRDIENRDYSAAIEKLSKTEKPLDPAVAWEVAFWKGFAYFQTEDYGDAATTLSPAWQSMKSMKNLPGTPRMRRTLLFQLGASWFLLGDVKSAIPLFEAFVTERGGDEFEPYAYLFLAKAHSANGDSRKTRAVAEEALKKYRGTQFEAELSSFLK
jgi:outer membrane protein assembly factor BamD (BamD/ComL family)